MNSMSLDTVQRQPPLDMYMQSKMCVTAADPYTRPADMPLFAFLTFVTIPSRIPSIQFKDRCPDCASGFYAQVLEVASLKMSVTFAHATFSVDESFKCYTQADFEEAIRRASAYIASTR